MPYNGQAYLKSRACGGGIIASVSEPTTGTSEGIWASQKKYIDKLNFNSYYKRWLLAIPFGQSDISSVTTSVTHCLCGVILVAGI